MPPVGHRARAATANSSSSNIDAGRSLKRQKTRKGTRSCWACKRRKMKCTYANPTDDVCIGCARRCLDCISQEFPDQDPGPSSKSRMVGDRIGRLESMIQQLAEQVSGRVASSGSPSTVASIISIPVPPSMAHSKHQTLSEALLAVYPSPTDLRIIGSTGEELALYLHQELVAPSGRLQEGVALESMKLWGTPQQQQQQYTGDTHPALIARQMLLLAAVLQHMPAAGSARSRSSRYQQLRELSQPVQTLARRLAEAATTLVTAHDRFTADTVEGLECLWLEAVYHEHSGSLRRSWLTCRRAISAAEWMGLHGRRYPPTAPPKPMLQQSDGEAADCRQIWFRLVHSELALCLALEMPPSASCPDEAFTSVAYSADGDACTSKLERRHAAIASRLLRQSERDADSADLGSAHPIHTELEEAASAMPSGWWTTPDLADHSGGEDDDDNRLFEAMTKLRAQMFHFHLLLLAHLPCMLQAACSEPGIATSTTTTSGGHRQRRQDQLLGSGGRSICVEASRDLLRRFVHLRSCERTASCFRLLDTYARHAAATLLLALLLGGSPTTETTATTTFLGRADDQQHLSDRALASEAMQKMQLAGGEEEAAAVEGSTEEGDVLLRLLALEASGASIAVTYRRPCGAVLGNSNAALGDGDRDALELSIPLVGLVSITPQAQAGSALSEGNSVLSGTPDRFALTPDDEMGLQGSDGDGEEEEDEEDDGEDEEEDEEEDELMKAMKLRRSAKWAIAHYMLRPA